MQRDWIIKNGLVIDMFNVLFFSWHTSELKMSEIRPRMINFKQKCDEIKSYFIFSGYWRVSKEPSFVFSVTSPAFSVTS